MIEQWSYFHVLSRHVSNHNFQSIRFVTNYFTNITIIFSCGSECNFMYSKAFHTKLLADMIPRPAQIHLLVGVLGWLNILPSSSDLITHTEPYTFFKTGFDNAVESEESSALSKCLEISVTVDPDEQPLSSLKSDGALECWQYCKYTFECSVISYDTISGMCLLYTEYQAFKRRQSKEFNYVVRKECMEKGPAEKALAAGVANPRPGSEFLIRQSVPQMGCLTKVKSVRPDVNLVEVGGYRLRWSTCAESNSWGLRKVEHRSEKIENFEFYQIYMIEEPEMCLDVKQPESNSLGRRQAILTKCREISQINEEDKQIMFLMEEDFLFQSDYASGFSIYSITETRSKELTWALYTDVANDKNSGPLMGLAFTPSTMRDQAGCSLSKFDTLHGRVENKEKVPFFLPGEKVTVLCEPGYGVSALNYSAVQSIVCGGSEKTQPCTLIRKQEDKEKDEDEEENEGDGEELEEEREAIGLRFYLSLGFGIVGSTVAVIELVVILLNRRKTENKGDRCVQVTDAG